MSESLVRGFRHIGIIVKNMESSRRFYEDILGLKVIQNYKDSSKYINDVLGLSDGNIHMIKLKTTDNFIIELLEYINHPTDFLHSPFYNVGTCHIAFTVENVENIYELLQSEEVEIVSKPLLSSEKTAKVFFCNDPNGIRVELVEMIKDK